ncbi:uncharacterized protein OCT59_007413 [Rhizophagus irregularis]|uniref:uncharacterized protein n=1 Tax=Rhizophagus irregularis TaxID=588596 RepID=UPI001A02DD6B|nr:hypothetical protein OCT59_007413 [Rhizophagus irregularis]GET62156.1 hypothetical protein GLOIN_2v1776430 [Rhizophagus irregularis DAOM 181602=DAOM 197198]CAB5180020.1 unnamed protein product [Rhizophagus irregularis]CAG8735211.1 18383_t:CDS:2 [Rhizophagus irregularis]
MLQNKPRKANIAALPFCIRNNFRRLPNRFLLSDNDDNEKMRSDNGDDLEQQSNDDHLEQRTDNDHLEQRNDNDNDLEQ